MSNPCEIVADSLSFTSTTTETVVIVALSRVYASSEIQYSFFSGVLSSNLQVQETVETSRYALISDSAVFTTTTPGKRVVQSLGVTAGAEFTTTVNAVNHELVVTTVQATSYVELDNSMTLLESKIEVVSSVLPSVTTTRTVTSELGISDSASFALAEYATDNLGISDSVTANRSIQESLIDNLQITEQTVLSVAHPVVVCESHATFTDTVQLRQTGAWLIIDEATFTDDTFFINPDNVAWVINTENNALSWYTGYGFNSMVQTPYGIIAVSDMGLYIIDGDQDDNNPIKSTITSGFTDFGTDTIKRVDNIYVGYTSSGQISVNIDVQDSRIQGTNFELEERLAPAPRNSRIPVGKGLFGRFWRTRFENKEGADFELYDVTADVADSKRRL